MLFPGGHLAWPLFSGLVFSMVMLLIIDVIWRMITIRFFVLLAIAIVLWVVGIAGICWV